MNSKLVVAAIEAGVRLGRKFHAAMVDEAGGRLLLPTGLMPEAATLEEARGFFDRPENHALVKADGPYAGLSDGELTQACRTVLHLRGRLEMVLGNGSRVTELLLDLHRFEQLCREFGPKSPLPALLRDLVEVGVDYFTAHPEAMICGSSAQETVRSFLGGLDPADFPDGSRGRVVLDLFRAALRTLGQDAELTGDDPWLRLLFGGVAKALLQDVNRLSIGAQPEREEFLGHVMAGLVRGGRAGLAETSGWHVGEGGAGRGLVESAVTQVLEGVRHQEELFPPAAIEALVRAAVRVLGEHPEVFTANNRLLRMIRSAVEAMSDSPQAAWYPRDLVGRVLLVGVGLVTSHPELISGEAGSELWLSRALSGLAQGFSRALAGPGRIGEQLSRGQQLELVGGVLEEVARNPDRLLGGVRAEPRRMVLVQAVASTVRALGRDAQRYVSGTTLIALLRGALRVCVRNVDAMVGPLEHAQSTNHLFRVLRQLIRAIEADGDPRRLVNREVFLEVAIRVLQVSSANCEPTEGLRRDPVLRVMRRSLGLARGVLAGHIDGASLPILVEGLLRQLLWEELRLEDSMAVEEAARQILRGV